MSRDLENGLRVVDNKLPVSIRKQSDRRHLQSHTTLGSKVSTVPLLLVTLATFPL